MRIWLAILLVVLLGFSCDKDNPDSDRLEYTPQRVEIPAGLNPVLAWVFEVGPVTTDHARFESITSTPWDDWTRIEPARASLTIAESGLNWSFVQEISLRAYSGDRSNSKEIFYLANIPTTVGNRLDLIPTDFNANPGLLEMDEITLELELTILRSSPPQNLPVEIRYSFEGFR